MQAICSVVRSSIASIFCCLSEVGLWRHQVKQGPHIPLPRLVLGGPKVFPSKMRYIISKVSLDLTSGLPPVRYSQKTTNRGPPNSILIRLPNHLEEILYTQKSSGSGLSSLSLGPSHPVEETSFSCNQIFLCCYQNLMTVGAGYGIDVFYMKISNKLICLFLPLVYLKATF